MGKAIANQEVEFLKMRGTCDEAVRRLVEAGGYHLFQKIIDDPQFRVFLAESSVKSYGATFLNFNSFLYWLRENNLEPKLEGGSLEKQIHRQEEYYRVFYGKSSALNRDKISISIERLPAIKKGLEIGAVNYALVIATPKNLSDEEGEMTKAQYVFHKLLKPLKKEGMKIWAETGTDRWTKLTLKETLRGYIPVSPEDFNSEGLEKDWVNEIKSVIAKKGQAPKQRPGKMETVFTDCRQDVPGGQILVNQKGEEVKNEYSFVKMIQNNVRILTPEQWIILASQSYSKDKTYLSRNTWDWTMAVLNHQGKQNNPPVSAAHAVSVDSGVRLSSDYASNFNVPRRWRLAL